MPNHSQPNDSMEFVRKRMSRLTAVITIYIVVSICSFFLPHSELLDSESVFCPFLFYIIEVLN